MSNEQLAEAVSIRDQEAPQVLLEASGGVNLTTVGEIAKTGVDRISVGALTHSSSDSLPSILMGDSRRTAVATFGGVWLKAKETCMKQEMMKPAVINLYTAAKLPN